MSKGTVLVVDDEANARTALAELLRDEGYKVEMAADGFRAMGKLDEVAPDVVLSDLKMPGMDGLELLRRVRGRDDDILVIVMTAFGAVETAVAAMKEGAADYVTKPIDMVDLTLVLARELERRRLRGKAGKLRSRSAERYGFANIVGSDPAMQEIFKTVARVAGSAATVLLTGESGTGKELFAAAIHERSTRAACPFLRLHCAAPDESQLGSELFGHEPGAFTGAAVRREGRLVQAHTGSLFLDEIEQMPPGVQLKLIRFLQEQAFERVGGTETLLADVRIIAATDRDLGDEVAHGRFLEDLFYRLNVIDIRLPPLRGRLSDVPLLAMHFLQRQGPANGKRVTGFTDEALERLSAYGWPGNVRELENVVERAVVLCAGDRISPAELPPSLTRSPPDGGIRIPGSTLGEIEHHAIVKALEATGGSTSRAAEMLGISVRKVQYKLHEYNSAPKSGVAVRGGRGAKR